MEGCVNNSLLHLGSMNFDLIKTIYNLNSLATRAFGAASKTEPIQEWPALDITLNIRKVQIIYKIAQFFCIVARSWFEVCTGIRYIM